MNRVLTFAEVLEAIDQPFDPDQLELMKTSGGGSRIEAASLWPARSRKLVTSSLGAAAACRRWTG